MGDADLKALVEHIAAESLPVVEDPGILSPRAFIDEVLHERFPNPAIPDTPQRIAADTSQKLPVRYGGTLRRYARQSEQALAGLEFAPWCSPAGAATCWGWMTGETPCLSARTPCCPSSRPT
ncbi:MAG: hypothetical protein ACLR0P_09305 [Oscillospiraceae bacterium]